MAGLRPVYENMPICSVMWLKYRDRLPVVAKLAMLCENFFFNAQEYYYWKFKDKIFLLLNLHHI
jgi:hypothetical protein